MQSLIIAFALAIVAVLGAGIALTVAMMQSRKCYQDSLEIRAKLSRLETDLSRTSSASLAAEVAALDAALAKFSKSVRSQFGSVWGTIGALEESTAAAVPASNGERPSRDQLRAAYLKPIGTTE